MAKKLIISVWERLEHKYKTSGATAILNKLNDLVEADANRGIVSHILMVDQRYTLPRPFPSDPNLPQNENMTTERFKRGIPEINDYCREIKQVIDAANEEKKFDYLLIVGGNDVVPFFRVYNPVHKLLGGDSDTSVPTDNYYGTTQASAMADSDSFMMPDLPVGRFADESEANDSQFLINVIDYAIKEANGEATGHSITWDGWALTATVWRQLSDDVSTQNGILASNILYSPPENVASMNRSVLPNGKSGHYFNLHGALRVGMWYGDSPTTDVFAPATVNRLVVPEGACIVTEACYGGDILARTSRNCNALMYLSKGCAAFAGASTIAYGAKSLPGLSADEIARSFMEEIRKGTSTGASLLIAKQKLFVSSSPFGGINPYDQKTLFQFILFGDPSHHPTRKHVTSHLKNVSERHFAMAEASKFLRQFCQLAFASTFAIPEITDISPKQANQWLQKVEREMSAKNLRRTRTIAQEIVLRPELLHKAKSFMAIGENMADSVYMGVSKQPARTILAVHRAYVGKAPVTNEGELPEPVHIASAYFFDDVLLFEAVVSSK